MQRSRLVNILLILLILIAALYLSEMLWRLVGGFSDIILLFLLGWLLSFVLNPVVAGLSEKSIPESALTRIKPYVRPAIIGWLAEVYLTRAMAVSVVYSGLVLALVIVMALLVPAGINQLTLLATRLPQYMTTTPQIGGIAQEQLARLGLQVNLDEAVRATLGGLQSVITPVVKNALDIFTSAVNFVANLFFVLILGFYFTLDGPRLRDRLLLVIPAQFQFQVRFFGQSVDRTFGAFIRGQLIQSFLVAIGTAFFMGLLGLDFVLVASVFAGLVMLIPLVGPLLALFPPLLVVLFQRPDLIFWLFLFLLVYQAAIINVLMPRVVGEAVGLHPLLIFAAIIVSIKLAGFWGAFFGIPIAGVIWAMFEFFFENWNHRHPTEQP